VNQETIDKVKNIIAKRATTKKSLVDLCNDQGISTACFYHNKSIIDGKPYKSARFKRRRQPADVPPVPTTMRVQPLPQPPTAAVVCPPGYVMVPLSTLQQLLGGGQ
jgi:hypothetical protein